MRKLFKAALRSLSNMKTTVTGLTILVFLSSAIFTLLADVQNAYTTKFKDYNKVSRLHDVTFDLDLNNEGSLGGDSPYTLDKEEMYMVDGTEGEQSVLLTQGYQKINSFDEEVTDTNGKKVVSEDKNGLKTNMFDSAKLAEEFQLYQAGIRKGLAPNQTESMFVFDLKNRTIEPKSDYMINLYELNNGDQKAMVEDYTIKKGDVITWDRDDYRLATTGKIDSAANSGNTLGVWQSTYRYKWYQSNKALYTHFKPTKNVYVNKKTKVATLQQPADPNDEQWFVIEADHDALRNVGEDLLGFRYNSNGKQWDSGKGYKLHDVLSNGINWDKAPLFTDTNGSRKVEIRSYHGDEYLRPTSRDYTFAQNDNEENSLKTASLKLRDFKWTFPEVSYSEQKASAVLKKGQKYTIPSSWIENITNEVYFTKHIYKINDPSQWEGSYLEWYQSLDPEAQKNLSEFSYWTKTIRKEGYTYDSKVDTANPNGDFLGVLLIHDIHEKIYPFKYGNDHAVIKDGAESTIEKVENFVTEDDNKFDRTQYLQHFANITNKDKLSERLSIISQGAKLITKRNVEKNVRELAGTDNVGVRRTMTVSSYDKTLERTQVFHFVDATRNRKILGYNPDGSPIYGDETVDKMYYEQLLNTALLTLDSTQVVKNGIRSEAKMKTPPPSFGVYMVNAIFRGFHIDPNYYSVDVEFANVTDKAGKQIERKLVKLAKVNSPSYYVAKVGNTFSLYDNQYKLFKDDLKYEEISGFMINQGYTVSGKIGENGWFKISDKNKNLIVPVQYRNLPSAAIDRAVNANEYDTFLGPIASTLEGILTVGDNPWMKSDVLNYLVKGGEEAMKNNLFYSVMETGVIDKALLGKLTFETLYFADQRNTNQPILNRIFSDMISHVKNLVSSAGDKAAQRKKFEEEIANIERVIGQVFGFKLPISISQFAKFTKDPLEFLDVWDKVIKSISSNVWLSDIKKWYDTHWEGTQPGIVKDDFGNPVSDPQGRFDIQYNYFGAREFITPLIGKAVNETLLLDAFKELIKNLDFNEIESKLMDVLSENGDNDQSKMFKDLFDQIEKGFNPADAGKGEFTHNIQYLIYNLINKMDMRKTMNYISNSFQTHSFKKVVDGEERWFQSAFTTQLDMISAIVKGIFTDSSKLDDIKDLIINGLNLSYKTVHPKIDLPLGTSNVKAPVDDPNKLDLYDVQKLEKLNYTKLETKYNLLNDYINGVNISDAQKIKVQKLVTDNYSEDTVKKVGIDVLAKRLFSIYSQLSLKKYKGKVGTELNPYSSQDDNSKNNYPQKQLGNTSTIGDVALWTIQNNFKKLVAKSTIAGKAVNDGSNKQAYDAVKTTVESSEFAAGANSLVMYNWYYKYIDVYIKTAMRNGDDLKSATDKAFNSLKLMLSLATDEVSNPLKDQSNETLYTVLKSSVSVDNHKVDVPVFSDINQPTKGSDALINTTNYSKMIVSHPAIEYFFDDLTNNLGNNSDVSKYIYDNYDSFTFQLGALAYSKARLNSTTYTKAFMMPDTPDTGLETSRWYLSLKDILLNKDMSPWYRTINNSFEDFEVLLKMSNSFSTQASVFEFLGISPAVASTYLGVIFPGVAKANTVTFDQNEKDRGNLAFVVERRLRNFGDDSFEDIRKAFSSFIPEKMLSWEVEQHGGLPLRMDMYYLKHLSQKMRDTSNDMLLDLDLADTLDSVMDSATEIVSQENQIRFLNIGAYVSKVSESYLQANGKKSFYDSDEYKENGMPDNIDDMISLLNTIDSDYLININNQKFLVLGKETAVDYMYPVLDEANINVDTDNQAVIFVNEYGFQRIVQANQDVTVKEYLTIKGDAWKGGWFDSNTGKFISHNKPANADSIDAFYADGSNTGLRDALRLKTRDESVEKVFLSTESDPVNPERAMRVTTVQTVIDAVTQLQFYGVLFMLVLVGAITMFISIRYIDNRRVVIGILRAQGYSKISIAISFSVFAILTGLIGGVAGYLLGHFTQIPVMRTFASFWTVPTGTSQFSWWSMLLTVLAPIVGMIILIVISAMIILRTKTVNLMSGSNEAASGWFTRLIIKPFKKFSIITRFRAILTFNSIWKLISLSVAITLSSVVAIFSISSLGVFDKAVTRTYAQRDYKYSIDLYTPTVEGGGYDVVDKNATDALEQIYIPMGNNLEGNTYAWDYFKPGASSVMDLRYPDGRKTDPGRAHIMSKSSLDITVNTAIAANPWKLAKNAMPDSQYVSALETTAVAAIEMMFTQIKDLEKREELRNKYLAIIDKWRAGEYPAEDEEFNPWLHSGAQMYMETLPFDPNKAVPNYFMYVPSSNNEGRFIQRIYSTLLHRYESKEVTTDVDTRESFRKFLFNSYQNKNVDDYLMIYGGVSINPEYDETYSWADITLGKSKTKVKITGIDIKKDEDGKILESYSNPETDGGEDIKAIIDSEYKEALVKEANGAPLGTKENPFPIAPNEVVRRVWGLSKNQVLEANVFNLSTRLEKDFKRSEALGPGEIKTHATYYVKVAAINATYINTEIITSQDAVNKMIKLDQVAWRGGIKPFNGIFTKNDVPAQAIRSLSLYSQSGYWGAMEGIEFPMKRTTALNIARNIFGDPRVGSVTKGSLFEAKDSEGNPIYTEKDMDEVIQKVFPSKGKQLTFADLKAELAKDTSDSDGGMIEPMLHYYNSIYGSTLYTSAISNLSARDIEAGFVKNISGTVNIITTTFIGVSTLISLIVMMIISTMIVNENKKKIATFSVMGFSEREKIRMFMFVYIPFIVLSILISIPIAYGIIALFNAVILGTANMALPLIATWWHIAIAATLIFIVFTITISIAYRAIRKIKPIYILQGDD